ncbi:unnamed protein product, partial [Symbiodinium sp. CCMP2456]
RRAEALQRDLTEPERRGLEVGRFGRSLSILNILSRMDASLVLAMLNQAGGPPPSPRMKGAVWAASSSARGYQVQPVTGILPTSACLVCTLSPGCGGTTAPHCVTVRLWRTGWKQQHRQISTHNWPRLSWEAKVLTGAKRFVKGALSTGHSFDEAIRTALASSLSGQSSSAAEVSNCSKMQGSKRRRARAGGAGKEPEALFLRFYAAVQLGGGFNSLLRSPCCWDLDSALAARRRLLMALDCQGQPPLAARRLRSLPHRVYAEVLERLRLAHEALYMEQDSVAAAATAAARNFKRVSQALLQYRDDLWRRELRRALRRRRTAQVPAASRGPSWRPCAGEGVSRIFARKSGHARCMPGADAHSGPPHKRFRSGTDRL